jgi:phosphate acetyltransferase
MIESVSKHKTPNSNLKGEANIFVFPDLNAGNISYKIAQRLGGCSAIGPMLQGIAKPVNDLSRGCSAKDIVDLSIITALQSAK